MMAISTVKPSEGERYTYTISPEDQQLIIDAFVEYRIDGADFYWEENPTEVTVYGGPVPALE